jgi:hypothetical protein
VRLSKFVMYELITNLHMHTTYSDGGGTHQDIIRAALRTAVDVVIVTDHNLLVEAVEGYTRGETSRLAARQVLMLAGEEVHDRARDPQKSHLLVLGANREMASYAAKPQFLIDQATRAGGLTFLAHPYDPELRAFGQDDISWVDWDVRGFTGLELWNGLSELKGVVRGRVSAIFYAFFPSYLARGPFPSVLKKWDALLEAGRRVVAVGGSDAHALPVSMGPLRRTIFPYVFHFQTINTHLLVENDLSGDLAADKAMIYNALRNGHAFIGYDLPHPTRGFRFTAQGRDGSAIMGDEIRLGSGVTLQIRLPMKAECRLLHNGAHVRTWKDREICAQSVAKPGAYRVECSIEYLGRQRGWIYSNPIYIRA